MADTLIVIPARYASTRFPGKPLADIAGKLMIQRVIEQCLKVQDCDVCVATDDQRISKAVKSLGYQVYNTSKDHISGTDRVAEVANQLQDYKYIINVQGDEPCIDPEQIIRVKNDLINGARIATLRKEISAENARNHSAVKVVTDLKGNALYFSRSLIPYQQNAKPFYYKHIGVYGFVKETLLKVAKLEPTPLEKMESLEQLRWLENGFAIKCSPTKIESPSVDTPGDIEKVVRFLKANS